MSPPPSSHLLREPGPGAAPRWAGPPDGDPGTLTSLRAALVRSPDLEVVARRFTAYPVGFAFELAIRGNATWRIGPWGPTGPGSGEAAAEEDAGRRLVLSVGFADGRSSTDLGAMSSSGLEGFAVAESQVMIIAGGDRVLEPRPPVLVSTEGRSVAEGWDQDYWVWGTPPRGPVRLSLSWAAAGISERSASVDGSALRGVTRPVPGES